MERGQRESFYHGAYTCFVSRKYQPDMGGYNFTWLIRAGRYEASGSARSPEQARKEAELCADRFAKIQHELETGEKP